MPPPAASPPPAPTTADEFRRALTGILLLIGFEKLGVAAFAPDVGACRRSFRAWWYATPALLLTLCASYDMAANKPEDPYLWLASQVLCQLTQIVALPLALWPLLRLWRRQAAWAWLVTGINWLNLAAVTVQACGLMLLAGSVPEIGLLLWFGGTIYYMVVEAFMAMVMLRVGPWRAALIMSLDFILNAGLSEIARALGYA